MSTSATFSRSKWSFRHAWHSESDLAALALCREELRDIGIDLIDAQLDAECDVVKMHGMDIADARDAPAGMYDLRAIAIQAGWPDLLPELVCKHMRSGESWHGIPLGIHQSNLVWVNQVMAEKVGTRPPDGFPEFVAWLTRAQRYLPAPLAIGGEPWQIAVLFEAAVLAVAGKALYCRAFVNTHPSVWQDPAMLQVLEQLMALRPFVDDEGLKHDWAFHLSRVQRGEAAVQFMGDWARLASVGLTEWPAPGTADRFVAIVDYFVPLARSAGTVADRAALKLTDPAFQSRFAMRKGCVPVVSQALPRLFRPLPPQERIVPSVAFDQCCQTPTRRTVLETVAQHFIRRSSAATCARAIADAVN